MKKFIWIAGIILSSCSQQKSEAPTLASITPDGWKFQFEKELPLLGHRNWIIVADKAFPEQNAAGIEYINTNENLMPVLQYVLEKVNGSGHVKPIIYRDKELGFITEEQVKGIEDFRSGSEKILKAQNPNSRGEAFQTILHDSVFTKLDAASKLFKVVVLKTNETLPYTSVFLQLDCAYWNGNQEKQLREAMSK
ncbi:MAG: hypothetical protein C5B52_02105 [Bacteroidetes bacterium]|nr:MAG: hypothetical protein C5B52_02105 [Bacteroidota bacterium]